jgi:alpha-L-rhamnosidase
MLQEAQPPSWLYAVLQGATTIWERWDSLLPDGSINPGHMTSFNQFALGTVAKFLYEVVGGLSPLAPGWKKVRVRPQPGGTVTSATCSHVSPYGEVSCRWEIQGGNLHVIARVPPNTTAMVVLPGVEEEVGSGEWTYVVPWKADERWPPQSIQHAFMNPQEEKLVV